jgi:hypothetical protein
MKINMPIEGLLQEPPDFSLVLGGPLYQMYRRTHLTGTALELLRRRVVFFWVLCWVRWRLVLGGGSPVGRNKSLVSP